MKLYHVTDKAKLDSIERTGLITERRTPQYLDPNEVQLDRILEHYRPAAKRQFRRKGVYFYPDLKNWKECVLEVDDSDLDTSQMWAASAELGDDLIYVIPETTLEEVLQQERDYVPVAERSTSFDPDIAKSIQRSEDRHLPWKIAREYWKTAEPYDPSKTYPTGTEIIHMGDVPANAIRLAQCKTFKGHTID